MPNQHTPSVYWLLLLVSIFVIGCRDRLDIQLSKANQCSKIKEIIARLDKSPTVTTKAGILADAASKEELAKQLESLELEEQQLGEFRSRLVTGYREQAQAYRDYATWVSEGGVVIINAEDESKLNEIDARLKTVSEKLKADFAQVSSYCVGM